MVLDPSPATFLNDIYAQIIGKLDLSPATNNLRNSLNSYIIACAGEKSPLTVENYQRRLKPLVSFLESQGIQDATKVQPQHIRLYLLLLQQQTYDGNKKRDPVTINGYYRVAHSFFSWLLNEGTIKIVPFQNVNPPRIPRKVVRPFTNDDLSHIMLLCSGSSFIAIRNRAMILVLLDTGLRLNEVSKIQLPDIDFAHETIRVMGKGSKERVVRIGKSSQKALLQYLLMRKAQPDNHPDLWLTEDHLPMNRDAIRTMVKRLCKRAEVSARPGAHTFRHTFGTQSLINGADIRDVQSLLGHSTLTMTLRYVATVNSERAVISHKKFSPADNFLK